MTRIKLGSGADQGASSNHSESSHHEPNHNAPQPPRTATNAVPEMAKSHDYVRSRRRYSTRRLIPVTTQYVELYRTVVYPAVPEAMM